MRTDQSWSPTPEDLDWIESISAPVIPALAAIEEAAGPLRVPIVGESLQGLAGRQPDFEDRLLGQFALSEVGRAQAFD